MRRKVFFRADGNTEIGLGHLVRSCALASMISDEFDVTFLTRENNEPFVRDELASFGGLLELIPEQLAIDDEPGYLMEQFLSPQDILVLDGYKFDSKYQKTIKRYGNQLVCIDDLHAENFVADVVINHAIGISEEFYCTDFYTKLLLGPAYALLRQPFLNGEPVERNFENHHTALICFGGSDLNNYTVSTLERLLEEESINTIHIVVGSAFPYVNKLNDLISNRNDSRIHLHRNISADAMKRIMMESDIAVCSASSVSIEYMSVGGGLFLIQTVDNQQDIFKKAVESGVAYDFVDFGIKKNFAKICDNQRLFFDGGIKSRYKKIFHQLDLENNIQLQRINESDANQLFQWTNEPQNRLNSYNSDPINWEAHINWVKRKLADENSYLYIFYKESKAVGTVRFDFIDNEFVVGFSVDKELRGFGIGRMILKKAILKLGNIRNGVIVAHVKETNLPSCKVFESLKFKRESSTLHSASYKYILTL